MKLILEYEQDFYKIKSYDNEAMHTLGDFLITDLGSGKETFKRWITSAQSSISGNSTYLYKNQNKIYIEYLWTSENYNTKTEIELDKDQFSNLLDKMDQVFRLKPQKIIVNFENDKLIIETAN